MQLVSFKMVVLWWRNLSLHVYVQTCFGWFLFGVFKLMIMDAISCICLLWWVDCHVHFLFLGESIFHVWLMMMNAAVVKNPNVFSQKNLVARIHLWRMLLLIVVAWTYWINAVLFVCSCWISFWSFAWWWSLTMLLNPRVLNPEIRMLIGPCTVPLGTGQSKHFTCPSETGRFG